MKSPMMYWLAITILVVTFRCSPVFAHNTGSDRKSDIKKTSLKLEFDLNWMRIEGSDLDRAINHLRRSPEWKEMPPTTAGYRRFVKREPWSVDGERLYRQKFASSVRDPRFGAQWLSGCMEIVVSRSQPIVLPQSEFWRGHELDCVKVDGDFRGTFSITIRQNSGTFESSIIINSGSLVITIQESSQFEERLLTQTWLADVRKLLTSDSPPELTAFDAVLDRMLSSDAVRPMTLMKMRDITGYYDAYGFVVVPEEGMLSLRIFDMDLNKYIDDLQHHKTNEVVGSSHDGHPLTYWNCFLKVPCWTPGDERVTHRHVRVELYFSPSRANSNTEKLAEIEIPMAKCWRFCPLLLGSRNRHLAEPSGACLISASLRGNSLRSAKKRSIPRWRTTQ